jgi:hypothetical protein
VRTSFRRQPDVAMPRADTSANERLVRAVVAVHPCIMPKPGSVAILAARAAQAGSTRPGAAKARLVARVPSSRAPKPRSRYVARAASVDAVVREGLETGWHGVYHALVAMSWSRFVARLVLGYASRDDYSRFHGIERDEGGAVGR